MTVKDFPAAVELFGRYFKVQRDEGDIEEGMCAQVDIGKQLILIRPVGEDFSQESAAEALLHEMLHIISDFENLGLSEEQIERLALHLFVALKQNCLMF